MVNLRSYFRTGRVTVSITFLPFASRMGLLLSSRFARFCVLVAPVSTAYLRFWLETVLPRAFTASPLECSVLAEKKLPPTGKSANGYLVGAPAPKALPRFLG